MHTHLSIELLGQRLVLGGLLGSNGLAGAQGSKLLLAGLGTGLLQKQKNRHNISKMQGSESTLCDKNIRQTLCSG